MKLVDYLIPEGKQDAQVQCYALCRSSEIDAIFRQASRELDFDERLWKIDTEIDQGDVLLLEVATPPSQLTSSISRCAEKLRRAGSTGDILFMLDGAYEGSDRLVSEEGLSQIYAFQRQDEELVVNLDLDSLGSAQWASAVGRILATVSFG